MSDDCRTLCRHWCIDHCHLDLSPDKCGRFEFRTLVRPEDLVPDPKEEKMEKGMDWDAYFMTLAYAVAMRSKDDSTKLGAVVVGPGREIRSTGYNSFPRGIDDSKPERQERPLKYFFMEHAERNAVINAARTGTPLAGCAMYTPCFPCADCARAIINAGITRLVLHGGHPLEQQAEWTDSLSAASEMLTEAGVEVMSWKGGVDPLKRTVRYGEHVFGDERLGRLLKVERAALAVAKLDFREGDYEYKMDVLHDKLLPELWAALEAE